MYYLKKISDHLIDMNQINQDLFGMYSECLMPLLNKYIPLINKQRNEKFIGYPYLLCASKNYVESQKRIMIFGQETNGWYGEKDKGIYNETVTIQELQNLFDLHANNPNRDGNTMFWQQFNRISEIAFNHDIGVISNNIAKIGYVYGYKGYDYNINVQVKDILCKEIQICKPQLIIMFSGPRYDNLVRQIFGDYNIVNCIDSVKERQCAEFIFPSNSVLSDIKVIRTYHPKYLNGYFKKNEKQILIQNFIKEVIQI